MAGYKAEITFATKELDKREKIKLKDLTNAIKLDEATRDKEIEIEVDMFAEIHVDNDNSPDKEYVKYVVVDTDGTKYVTGSENFYTTLKDIWDEMDGEKFVISVYQTPSKKYQGKFFISCSLV